MYQALQANIAALRKRAGNIIRNENRAMIENKDGVLQPVVDEGGRQCMQSLILDVQSKARGFDNATQATVESAVAETDSRLS
eukprot:6514023-Heterocapsa_arctica.AAC.1